MKTPREILLSRHSQTEEKLDVIREKAVRAVVPTANGNREFTFAATMGRWVSLAYRELVWRARWMWSGLAAAWVVIIAGNLHLDAGAPRVAANASSNAAEFILTLREQEGVMAELTGRSDVPAAVVPKRHDTQPRSEASGKSVMI